MKKIRVCNGPHCSFRQSSRVMDALREFFAKKNTHAVIDLEYCSCTGFCEQGPNVVVDDALLYEYAGPDAIGEQIERGEGKKLYDPLGAARDVASLLDNL